MEKKNYYCEYCGHKFPNVQQLASATCQRHPNGSNRGRHKPYEGSEKSSYTCKHCGKKYLQALRQEVPIHHGDGGRHLPLPPQRRKQGQPLARVVRESEALLEE